jgi:uncharacterized membrane protein HdeD (DUF308 family)
MPDIADGHLLKTVHRSGTALIALGLISLIAGILALVYPDITLLALAIIVGVNILFFGAFSLAAVFDPDADTGSKVLAAIMGVLGIIAGVVCLRRPGETLLALLLVLAVYLIVAGVVELVGALANPEHRGIRLLASLADLALGILILSWPGISLATLAILVGIGFVIRGVVWIVAGWQLRRVDASAALPAT